MKRHCEAWAVPRARYMTLETIAPLSERTQVHHVIAHRWFLGCVGVSQPVSTGESPVTTAEPPARYGAF
jgi:hypothetical protein